MKYLAENESAYKEYFEWKALPPTDHFKSVVDPYISMVFPEATCSLCDEVFLMKQQKLRTKMFNTTIKGLSSIDV